MKNSPGLLALSGILVASMVVSAQASWQDAQDAGEAKRTRLKDNAADFWIYDDLEAAQTKAAQTGKPLLVSFRCVP